MPFRDQNIWQKVCTQTKCQTFLTLESVNSYISTLNSGKWQDGWQLRKLRTDLKIEIQIATFCYSQDSHKSSCFLLRYKTQLRDFLSTCRTKRKMSSQHSAPPPPTPAPPIEYLTPPDVAAAYSNMYTTGYGTSTPEYMSQGLYDNRLPYENLFHQYRPYYPEYQPYTVSNGFSLPTYEVNKSNDCDKLYCHQSIDQNSKSYSSPYITLPLCSELPQSHKLTKSLSKSMDGISSNDSSPVPSNHLTTPKVEDIKSESFSYSEIPRQTVLMWGSNPSRSPPASPILPNGHSVYPQEIKKYNGDPLKSLAEMNSIGDSKWKECPPVVSPKSYYQTYNENGPSEVWPGHHQFYSYHHHPWVHNFCFSLLV